jgi:hypothetical protein
MDGLREEESASVIYLVGDGLAGEVKLRATRGGGPETDEACATIDHISDDPLISDDLISDGGGQKQTKPVGASETTS